MSGRKLSALTVALVAPGFALAACGAGDGARGHGASGDSAGGHGASYPVRVAARFPASQRLAQQTDLKIDVTNAGTRAIPDVMVTLTNPRYGTAAQALSTLISAKQPRGQQPLASRSRPVWMITREPGPCHFNCRYGTGAFSADANTWALGRLAPGHTARFDWHLTAVRAGSYAVAYRVAAGPDTGSRAVLAGGAPAGGRFNVSISSRPAQLRFTASGRVVSASGK